MKSYLFLLLLLIIGCLKPYQYYHSPIYGMEIDSQCPYELGDMADACWHPFNNLGASAPWRVEEFYDTDYCGCVGYYSFGAIHIVAPYATLPHEFAHHASAVLYGHPQSDHNWTSEIRTALNKSADILGMGHEW